MASLEWLDRNRESSSRNVTTLLRFYSGLGCVVGLLKTGSKNLFMFDETGTHYQLKPRCVLDFYVHESRQRMGLGNILYEYMLSVSINSNLTLLILTLLVSSDRTDTGWSSDRFFFFFLSCAFATTGLLFAIGASSANMRDTGNASGQPGIREYGIYANECTGWIIEWIDRVMEIDSSNSWLPVLLLSWLWLETFAYRSRTDGSFDSTLDNCESWSTRWIGNESFTIRFVHLYVNKRSTAAREWLLRVAGSGGQQVSMNTANGDTSYVWFLTLVDRLPRLSNESSIP